MFDRALIAVSIFVPLKVFHKSHKLASPLLSTFAWSRLVIANLATNVSLSISSNGSVPEPCTAGGSGVIILVTNALFKFIVPPNIWSENVLPEFTNSNSRLFSTLPSLGVTNFIPKSSSPSDATLLVVFCIL